MDFQNPFWLNFCFETGLELKGHSTIEANTCEAICEGTDKKQIRLIWDGSKAKQVHAKVHGQWRGMNGREEHSSSVELLLYHVH